MFKIPYLEIWASFQSQSGSVLLGDKDDTKEGQERKTLLRFWKCCSQAKPGILTLTTKYEFWLEARSKYEAHL
jgi:hypothetical protein